MKHNVLHKTSEGEAVEQIGSYADLERMGRKKLLADGRSQPQVSNFVTALNAWCSTHQREKSHLIRLDLTDEFDKRFLRYQDILSEKIAPRTLKDRCEQILWWRQTFIELLGIDILPQSFGEALTVAFQRSGVTKAELCRTVGFSGPTLDRWLTSDVNLTEPSSIPLVTDLERALDLTPGTLSKRLSTQRRRRYERMVGKTKEGPQTTYGLRLQRNKKKLSNFSLQASNQLKSQWAELLALKTDGQRNHATSRNTWRVKPRHKVGNRLHWSMVIDGKVCVTGGAQYRQIVAYLGFLALAKNQGGFGIAHSNLDTLAWLVRADFVIAYLRFVRKRADGILHNGLFTLLNTFRSHLRPKTGFLWLNPELAITVADVSNDSSKTWNPTVDNWQTLCEQSYQSLMDYTRKLGGEGKTKRSRDPNERVRYILANEQPLKALMHISRELENDPPPQSQKKNYAVWLRDVLLLKMLIRHPLRVHHYSIMTFRGAMPNLYRSGKSWEMFFGLEDFKNEKSSAASEYRVKVDETLTPWLSRYLNEARPRLIAADDCDFLFLSSAVGNAATHGSADDDVYDKTGAWSPEGISFRIKALTERYVSDGTSFSAHAIRHIIATDHLKRNPGEYVMVAKILNDSLSTVLKEYDHTGQRDAIRVLGTSIDIAERELKEESRYARGAAI